MSFTASNVKELIRNDFPVVSLGLHYYDYANNRIILKDIIHNKILKEKVAGNFGYLGHIDEIVVFEDLYHYYYIEHYGLVHDYYYVYIDGGSEGSIYFLLGNLRGYHRREYHKYYEIEIRCSCFTRYFSYIYVDEFRTIQPRYPTENIMSIRPPLFNFYHFVGPQPPPFWFIPIGEFGFIKYTLNAEGKLDYVFIPWIYIYHGIYTYAFAYVWCPDNRARFSKRNDLNVYNYHWYRYQDLFTHDIKSIPYLYVFGEGHITNVFERFIGVRFGPKINNWGFYCYTVINDDGFYEKTVNRNYYFSSLLSDDYLFRPAIIGLLNQKNKLLYISRR